MPSNIFQLHAKGNYRPSSRRDIVYEVSLEKNYNRYVRRTRRVTLLRKSSANRVQRYYFPPKGSPWVFSPSITVIFCFRKSKLSVFVSAACNIARNDVNTERQLFLSSCVYALNATWVHHPTVCCGFYLHTTFLTGTQSVICVPLCLQRVVRPKHGNSHLYILGSRRLQHAIALDRCLIFNG